MAGRAGGWRNHSAEIACQRAGLATEKLGPEKNEGYVPRNADSSLWAILWSLAAALFLVLPALARMARTRTSSQKSVAKCCKTLHSNSHAGGDGPRGSGARRDGRDQGCEIKDAEPLPLKNTNNAKKLCDPCDRLWPSMGGAGYVHSGRKDHSPLGLRHSFEI